MNRKILIPLLAILNLAYVAATAGPVSAAFTYQGLLTKDNNPANGSYVLTFSLYDALTGGNQLGPTLTKTVTVARGLFTAQLDFGVGVFLGEKRWLETAVAGQTLSPRVELTAAPYALVAAKPAAAANAFDTRSYASGLVGVADIQECTPEGRSSCVAKQTITLALAYGQTITLDLLNTNYPMGTLTEMVHVEISKAMRQLTLPGQPGQPDTQVNLPDSPVVSIIVSKASSTPKTITLSPDNPIYNTEQDPGYSTTPCPMKLLARLLSDSLLFLELDKSYINVITSESLGAIKSATVEPYKQGAREAELSVTAWNAGEYKADFILTVTGLGAYAEPVVAQSVTLDLGETSTQTFTLRSTKALTSANTCTASLRAPDGKLHDSVVVHFPEPTAP